MRKWIKYEIELVTKAPFRIGGVKPIPGTTDVDSPVVKLGNRIVVQGTSLKGALRAELERYLIDSFFDKESNKWKNEWMKPCIPADEKTISPDEKKLLNRGLYKYSCSYPNSDDYICPVCYLLGARGLVGFVEVPFLNMVKGDVALLQFIRADRVTGTSAKGEKGAIGKFEAVPEGSVFKGVMTVLKEDDIIGWKLGEPRDLAESKGDKWLESGDWDKEKILKELLEDRVKSITKLGGYKSKGFGDVEIKISRM
jgi:CRISPR/Cas system CSM-associated protein Csm3 (group 7 of RAMP superfamily)